MNDDDQEEQNAAQAEFLDQSLVIGELRGVGPLRCPETSDALAAYMAARASLQLLERVWPRGESRGSPRREQPSRRRPSVRHSAGSRSSVS